MAMLLNLLQPINEFDFYLLNMPANEPAQPFLHNPNKLVSATRSFYIKTQKSTPDRSILVMKHQYPFDWGDFNFTKDYIPTFINVIRNPIDHFQSSYYFKNNGWVNNTAMSIKILRMNRSKRSVESLETCVRREEDPCQCLDKKVKCSNYLRYLCGNIRFCPFDLRTKEGKLQAVQLAKIRLESYYYLVGLIEYWEETLKLFEAYIPSIYGNAGSVWKNSDEAMFVRNKTKTRYGELLSKESREKLLGESLKYEYDVYNYAKQLFFEKLKFME